MKEYNFLFYRDTEQKTTDWHDTLAVIAAAGRVTEQAYSAAEAAKAKTATEPAGKPKTDFAGKAKGSTVKSKAEQALGKGKTPLVIDADAAESVRVLTCRMVSFATEFGLYGNLWQQWIAYMLIMHENAFTLACERRWVGRTSTIMKLAEEDFALFMDLFKCDLDALGSQTGTDLLAMMANYIIPFAHDTENGSGRQIRALASRLANARDAKEFGRIMADYYAEQGVGEYSLYRAFRVAEGEDSMRIVPIAQTADITFNDLIGYDEQKKTLKENTEAFVGGLHANNVLLYGDSGTGKSTSVHALMHDYFARGLRLIEIAKPDRVKLPQVLAEIKKRNYRFIIFLDDLSFEENESDYKELKAMLEGALESRSDRVLIYATSNRRHLIRETWGDRADMEYNEDIHRSDTMEEKLSLASRFGVTIYYAKPDPEEYMNIVKELAKKNGIETDEKELEDIARKWELRHGGMSGRTASQLITWLKGEGLQE